MGVRRTKFLGLGLVFLCAAAHPTGAPLPAPGPVGAASPSAAAQGRPKAKVAAPTLQLFAGNLKAARARAEERNVPILAIAVLDEESDNVAARTELIASPEIAALSGRCILFFSNHGTHQQREIRETDASGAVKTRSVCADFGTANCKEHQQHWDDIYNEYNEEGVLRCPQVLVLAPDGKLEERLSPGLKPEVASLVEAAAKLQAKLGRGLDEAALAAVKDAAVRASRAEQDGQCGAAWRAFAEVLAITPDGARAEAAKAGQARCAEWLDKRRAEAVAQLAVGDGLAGYLALEELARDWTGTAQAVELTRLMKQAEKEPRVRDAVAKKRREDEAQALWLEAQSLGAAKQPKEAEKKLRILLRKFEGTAAWERAAKARPDLVPQKTGG
ncbi:MAG: hypothetical protein IPK67_17435 [Planctomycetes bacterium]|nr:hypothetical protein [Planctomycetota bacterium]